LRRDAFWEKLDGKLGALLKEHAERSDSETLVMFQRAVERGELPRGTDIELLRDLMRGPQEQYGNNLEEKASQMIPNRRCANSFSFNRVR
jgi:hypothetical protein